MTMHYLALQEGRRKAKKVIATWECAGTKWEKILVRTRKPCSCPMCGNPRRYAKGEEKLMCRDKRLMEQEKSEVTSCLGV